MKSLINDYCMKMFVSTDTYRPALMKVSKQDAFLYATNVHIAAKIHSDLCIHHYETVEKFPNVEMVMEVHESAEKMTINVDGLLNEMMKIQCCFLPKMIDCNVCDGDAVLVCDHCNSTYDCKECGGTGQLPGKEIELISHEDCKLFNRNYTIRFLDMILKTALYTGVKEIEISNGKECSGSLFTVGDFTILLMPKLVS